MNRERSENESDDEVIAYQEEPTEEEDDSDGESFNLPLSGSALYPRIYTGDSAIPLMGDFHESEYKDDNITRTWNGILTSFYG